MLASDFKSLEISHIPQAGNAQVDTLSWLTTSTINSLNQTYVEHLETPRIDRSIEVYQVEHQSSWMDPIIKYLTNEVLSSDRIEAKRVKWIALQYIVMDGNLYKRSFTLPLLKYLGPTNVDYALHEVHKEIYKNHLESRSMAYKILRQRYYWPTIQKDITDFVKKCYQYQKYSNIQWQLASQLTQLVAPWLFA